MRLSRMRMAGIFNAVVREAIPNQAEIESAPMLEIIFVRANMR